MKHFDNSSELNLQLWNQEYCIDSEDLLYFPHSSQKYKSLLEGALGI